MRAATLLFLACVLLSTISSRLLRVRRQALTYGDDLKQLAHIHPGTKIIVGTAGRYAPQEWPDWYTRTIMQWEGHSRLAPFQHNDARFTSHQSGKSWKNIT